jgi:hypothetical protein
VSRVSNRRPRMIRMRAWIAGSFTRTTTPNRRAIGDYVKRTDRRFWGVQA